jgi:hypothetical protein
MKELSGDYWERLYSRTQEVLRLDEGEFDESQNEVERACLGTAVVCEPQAVNLALVGDLERLDTISVLSRSLRYSDTRMTKDMLRTPVGRDYSQSTQLCDQLPLVPSFFGESERDDISEWRFSSWKALLLKLS